MKNRDSCPLQSGLICKTCISFQRLARRRNNVPKPDCNEKPASQARARTCNEKQGRTSAKNANRSFTNKSIKYFFEAQMLCYAIPFPPAFRFTLPMKNRDSCPLQSALICKTCISFQRLARRRNNVPKPDCNEKPASEARVRTCNEKQGQPSAKNANRSFTKKTN
ncbi:hypothetical protein DHW03_14010 [Pedobacter yonginense]|uniref:Uncharacterized protein n=1 Tax=Pedobacter yonginense TaxID=651869 RepID=A0A317EMI9_9SPHI|nr:hypothetical protein DHW03_14010 [Pedobacter yonginense]